LQARGRDGRGGEDGRRADNNDGRAGGGDKGDDDRRGGDAQARREGVAAPTRESLLVEAARRLRRAVEREEASRLGRVINATGVVLHTNLGRAPLSTAARERLAREAAGYCTLEYDLTSGARGRRGGRVEALLSELTGAEDALVVNNCAAAALLVLSGLARDGETVVSRGELVEIGGDFRVPDVMSQSGTSMVEVGTTNRTRLSDYERAVNERTRLLMRVHPSNYRLVGFTAAPELRDLAALAHERGLLLYEDAGSGALVDLAPHGLSGEPVIRESIEQGADLVSFSGDKLLGAAQAGLVVGRREVVGKLRRHPLYRALRADKLALAALEATLEAYRRGAQFQEVPALRMLASTRDEIERRARRFVRRLRARLGDGAALSFELTEGRSAVGGGSAPTTHPPTVLVALTHRTLSAAALEASLRRQSPPVVARILDDRVVLDLRTVADDEEDELVAALTSC
ncbi:MAG TPA: L-seryl-tRNA(Sec) selenium transferase, partial [Pyrinomonadaceae bacterium]|nr:L-seryl-tRNA(Sec) selenium transferase [Pyrinomonadaceae bacterium]